VLRRIARGQCQPQIAADLSVPRHVVKHTVTLIMTKLDARNAANAVAIAYEAGLLSPGDARSMEGGSA
jgi:DNA-binding NarL/FixJ family response regulator